MRDTVKSLAKEIKTRWPYLAVRVEPGFCNTDRKIGRLRIPGKGRRGSKLTVVDIYGNVLLVHNNAQTYRRTSEIRAWMEQYAKSRKR